MKIARNAILIVLCLHYFICQAQRQETSFSDRYHLSHYTDENGLPQNSVKSITADNAGFIWINTESGLVRYDGQQFHTYNKSNLAIKNVRFYSLHRDLTGKRGLLYTFPPNPDHTSLRIESGNASVDSIHAKEQVNRMLPPENYERGQFMFTHVPTGWKKHAGSDSVDYLLQSSSGKGSFYKARAGKIAFYEQYKIRWEVSLVSTHFDDFFSVHQHLYRFSQTGELQEVNATGAHKVALSGDLIRDPAYVPGKYNFQLFWDSSSDNIFLLLNKNFYYLEAVSTRQWKSRLILSGFDFDVNLIGAAYYNPVSETLLLGSQTRGLFVFTPKQFRTLTVSGSDNDNIIYSQTAFGLNKSLIPTGVVLGTSNDTTDTPVRLPLIYNIKTEDKRSMVTDESGNVWLKSFHKLHKFTADGNRRLGEWDFDDEIKTVAQGKDQRIWVGLKSSGLYFMDRSSVPEQPKLFTSAFKEISFILQGGKQNLWVGTVTGLFYFNLLTRESTLISGTKNLNVRSLYISPTTRDGIFITTQEDGVFFYEGNKLTQFPLDANRNLSAAHCIVEDRKGFFWITTNKGLFQFSKADLIAYSRSTAEGRKQMGNPYYLYYTKEHGFNTNEFNGGCQPCAVRLPDGHVSLPSLNGLVWFEPEKIRAPFPDGKLIIDQILENGKGKSIVSDSIVFGLAPKQVSLHVTTPYFGNKENIQLSYAMIKAGKTPVPADWVRLKADDPVIRFSELSSGEYALLVRKVNGFGHNNYTTRRIVLIVPKQWFETDWFRVLCLLALGVAIYFYIKVRTAYLQVQNRVLEERVSSKTQRLELALAALQTSEAERSKQMNIHTHLLASISHDIRTPLKYILNLSERVEYLIEKEDMEMVSRITSDVATSSRRIFNLLDNMLAYIRTQVNHDRIKMHHVSLRHLVQEKASLFFNIMEEQENCFFNDVPGGYLVNSNGHLLGVIIHNLIDNANKNTFDGSIRIFTEIRDPYLHLVIADSGPGMPASIRNWMNGVIDPEQDNSGYDEKKGLGLSIVKELAESIDVRLRVEVKNGTRVHIIFDLADQVPIG